jgi:hypothetical protein
MPNPFKKNPAAQAKADSGSILKISQGVERN